MNVFASDDIFDLGAGGLDAMTQEESAFWNIAHDYALRKFGYSVVELKLEAVGNSYTLRLKELGEPEHTARIFKVFIDQLRNTVKTGNLPDGLLRDLPNQLK